jgi:carbon starvation protein
MVAPAFNDNVPAGTPSLLPLLFVTIACGAISGFHGLVSSGTTSKQLNKETDARFVGYFGAIGEGMLALAAILAATAGFATLADWEAVYTAFGQAASTPSSRAAPSSSTTAWACPRPPRRPCSP